MQKKYEVVGFDIDKSRVNALSGGHDNTLEVSDKDLSKALLKNNTIGLKLSFNVEDIRDCNIYIVTVPTPVDINNRPILTPLFKASETIGKILKKNDIVIYESTVYPGVYRRGNAFPILEKKQRT